MTRRALSRFALGLLLPAALLLVWHVAAAGSAIVPSIGAVLDVLVHPLDRKSVV